MESILARALESTLKYWLKSFSRDQFKLQGRTVQLSNLDINGDALHASTGLPPALNVAQAKVGRLEIKLPSVSNVQIDPVIVQIDKLDLVLEERLGFDTNITQCRERCNNQSSLSVSKSSGYGFADKIADGMTLQVGTVNLMLETRGSAGRQGGATWTPPLASITIRKLLLYTTSENWQVVSLKEAREFSSNKKCIYVFKKLEWESLSVDLLPHPDMFNDERLTSINLGESRRDDDGAKRLFFGGERFLDSISGQAYITIHRTEQNNPLGLEVQLHVTEAVCPALSEPGLRALLRFMTGLYVCLNRGDVDPRARQSTEAAGCSLVAVIVDHIFLCIKDAEFQLELLMQSLFFSRASISDGELTKTMTRVMIGGFFLRDTFSRPPCTLVQPSMQCDLNKHFPVPNFASEKLWPRIYPLKAQNWQMYEGVPMLCMYSLQTNPSPAPPVFASQTVVQCQPVKINLQEESCLRITSFLADGIVVHPGAVLPDTSVNSFHFSLNEFDITIPVDAAKLDNENWNELGENCFTGARLHVEGVVFAQSPSLTFKLLSLEKDPACFSLWKDQPIDSSQRKWVMRATRLSLCLETGSCDDFAQSKNISDWTAGLWHCVELHDPCIEGAMVTADGHPLVTVPPPGGVVRIGIACRKYTSNTSVEQLFFVLKLYAYIGRVSEEVSKIGRGGKEERRDQSMQEANGSNELNKAGSFGGLVEMVPSDTAVSLAVDELHLKFLESVPGQVDIQGPPLVQFSGNGLQVRVTHRTLGGAMAISSTLCWQRIQVDCVETELKHSLVCLEPKIEDLKTCPDGIDSFLHARMHNCSTVVDDVPQMRAVLWINGDRGNLLPNGYQNGLAGTVPFLDVNVVHVIPYRAQDAECHSLSMTAKVAGVRLGGGMTYNEALLHRFGILGPDGGPGEGLKKGLKNFSRGPLAKLLRSSPQVGGSKAENHVSEKVDNDQSLELGSPDDIEIDIQLQDWLFALEGAQDVIEGPNSHFFPRFSVPREQRCWHMAFRSLCVSAKSGQKSFKSELAQKEKPGKRHPVEVITVSVEGLLALKPQTGNCNVLTESDHSSPVTHVSGKRNTLMQDQDWRCKSGIACNGGVDLEVRMVIADNDVNMGMGEWVVDSLKGAVKEPVEVEATKEEVDYLVLLCKSEIESVSRITAGILKVLKLQGSIGQAAIVQLSNLGSGSLDQVITPDRFRRRSSIGSVTCTQSNLSVGNSGQGLDYTVSMLEQAVSESQNICTTLSRHLLVHSEETEDLMLSSSRIAPISVIANIKDLENQLEKMQTLLSNLRSEV